MVNLVNLVNFQIFQLRRKSLTTVWSAWRLGGQHWQGTLTLLRQMLQLQLDDVLTYHMARIPRWVTQAQVEPHGISYQGTSSASMSINDDK